MKLSLLAVRLQLLVWVHRVVLDWDWLGLVCASLRSLLEVNM